MKRLTLLLGAATAMAVAAAIYFSGEAQRLAHAGAAVPPAAADASAPSPSSSSPPVASGAAQPTQSAQTVDTQAADASAAPAGGSATTTATAAELEELRAQQAELPKLRGELARLRSEAQRAKLAAAQAASAASAAARQAAGTAPVAAPPAEVATGQGSPTSMQVTGRVAAGETMIVGSWVTSEGKRMVAFATPNSAVGGGRVLVRAQLIEATDDLWNQYGLGNVTPQDGTHPTVQQAVLDALTKQKGATVMAAPTLFTNDGDEARIQLGQMRAPKEGEPEQFMGLDLQLKSQPTEDRKSVDMFMRVIASPTPGGAPKQ